VSQRSTFAQQRSSCDGPALEEKDMPSQRTLVSVAELSRWLTTELRKFDGCEECEISSVYQLREPDSDGCNWSREGAPVSVTGVPERVLKEALAVVIARARQKFNLS
jgi:hypothetical protein